MFGRGELSVEGQRERLVVPQAAVQMLRGQHVVFVQQDDKSFTARSIALGLREGPYWEVTSGLNPGDSVATTGSFLLKSNLENSDFGKVE